MRKRRPGFTTAEVCQIVAQLPKKASLRRIDGVLRVSIGHGRCFGRVDRKRLLAVIIVVRRKRARGRLSKSQRIPQFVKFRVGRGKRRRVVRLFTDVQAARRVVPTGGSLSSGASVGSVGVLAYWAAAGSRHWGAVIAAHTLDDLLAPTPPILSVTRADGTALLIQTTTATVAPAPEPFDAALARVRSKDVRRWLGQAFVANPPDLVVRRPEQVAQAMPTDNDHGRCLCTHSSEPFDTLDWTPGVQTLTPALRPVSHIFSVAAALGRVDAFVPGVSGSACILDDPLDAPFGMLIASREANRRFGFAQALEPILGSLAAQVGASRLALAYVF